MGLLKKIDEMLATARYYRQQYDREMAMRYAEAAKQTAPHGDVVTLPARESEQTAKAA